MLVGKIRIFVWRYLKWAVVFTALALIFAIGSAAWNPKDLLVDVLDRSLAPTRVGISRARWVTWGLLEVDSFTVANIGSARRLTIQINLWRTLSEGVLYVDSIEIDSPEIQLSWNQTVHEREIQVVGAPPTFRKQMEKQAESLHQSAKKAGFSLRIKMLKINNGVIRITELGPGIPNINIPLATTFSNFVVGKGVEDPSVHELQTAVIHDFSLVSPYDPLAKTLEVPTLRVEFTLAGLFSRRLERVSFIGPTIYVGQDLFWLSEYISGQIARLPSSEMPPWTIGFFEIRGGEVVIATQGQPNLHLPFVFESEQSEMVLSKIQDLSMKASIKIPNIDLFYPEYTLQVEKLRGLLYFALPRSNPDANNIVNKLEVNRAQWRDFSAEHLWLAVTFDVLGIYASFGAEAYSGYINGDFTLLFQKQFEWTSSLSASKVDLLQFSHHATPDQVLMTGRASGKMVANGHGKKVDRVDGQFGLMDKGRVEILSMEKLLKELPPEWTGIKKELLHTVINAFRSYHYTQGKMSFAYAPPLSCFKMNMSGVEGARNMDVKYHHLEKQ